MANTAQAKRYAQAVFLIAGERQRLDGWLSDLRALAELQSDQAVMHALETPNYTSEDKAKLLKSRYPGLDPLAMNLLGLLIEKGRTSLIPGISDEFQHLVDRHRGVERADVVTAVPLTDEDRVQLERRLSSMTGKQVIVRPRVDQSIVGGVVARLEGKLLDGSTKSRLEALKREIAGVPR